MVKVAIKACVLIGFVLAQSIHAQADAVLPTVEPDWHFSMPDYYDPEIIYFRMYRLKDATGLVLVECPNESLESCKATEEFEKYKACHQKMQDAMRSVHELSNNHHTRTAVQQTTQWDSTIKECVP